MTGGKQFAAGAIAGMGAMLFLGDTPTPLALDFITTAVREHQVGEGR